MAGTHYFKNQVSSWTNAHWVYSQEIQGIYDFHNQAPFDQSQAFQNYVSQVGEIQSLIQELMAQKVRVRARGAGWSFSKVAATDGFMLNPQFLKTFFPLSPAHVVPGINNSNFFLFQCGMAVHDVHMALARHNKALPASGSSCGQSLIGAFTTGTHGSAFNGGPGTAALQDAVRGLHVVVGPNRHVWLAPQSNPVVTDVLIGNLGIQPADFIQDDDLFYSALNSLGGFGVIHGTLVEATDAFLLDASRYYTNFDSLKNAITSFDFTGVDLKGATKDQLYHFEVMNNIYCDDPNKRALVTIVTKTDKNTNPITVTMDPAGEELVGVIAAITGAAPAMVPPAINTFFAQHYPALDHATGTLADQNPYITNVGPGSIVCSLAMDMKYTYQAMQLCQALNTSNIPVWYEFRFVPKVKGVLAFQKFDHTGIFEIAGFGSALVLKYINDSLVELEKNGIPFTFHWGKYLPLGPDQTKYGYPVGPFNFLLDHNKLTALYMDGTRDNVAVWKAQRQKLFGGDKDLMYLFSNDVMEKLGIAD